MLLTCTFHPAVSLSQLNPILGETDSVPTSGGIVHEDH